MPIPKEIAEDRIGEPRLGDVWVFVDQYGGARYFQDATIPLDGRKYRCDGIVIFKNGNQVRAKFSITTSPKKVTVDNVICFYNGLWYQTDEDALFEELHTNKDEAVPMTCLPDRSLSGLQGPIPIDTFRVAQGAPTPGHASVDLMTKVRRLIQRKKHE